jgi:N-glycosylase/DNA lyase
MSLLALAKPSSQRVLFQCHTGVAGGKSIEVYYNNEILTLVNSTKNDVIDFWYNYFDLERDYSKIKSELSKNDTLLKKATQYGPGIRILNQEPFEVLISFIISQNNNIPRIKKCIDSICNMYGKKINENGYSFPKPEDLINITVDDISNCCHAGYRSSYIYDSCKMFLQNKFDKNTFANMNIDNARKILLNFKGVGPKVADCILLFTGSRQDVFPIDVWVKKIMCRLYNKDNNIYKFAYEKFGDLCGFAQQYLFYMIREQPELLNTLN